MGHSGHETSEAHRPAPGGARAWDFAALCALGAFLLFGFLTLGTYPPVNYNVGDEVWSVRESARALAEGMPRDLVSPKLYFLALGLWLKLTAGGLAAARALTLIAGAALIGVTALIGRELGGRGGRRAGAMAALLLASSFSFCWQAGIARHEMLSGLMAACAALAVLRARGAGQATPAPGAGGHLFVAGLLVTLSVNVHPNNLQYALTLPLLALAALGRGMMGRPLVGGALGYGAGLAVWLAGTYFPALAASAGAGAAGDPGTIARGLPIPILREDPISLLIATFRAIPGDFAQYVRIFDLYFPTTIPMPVPLALGATFMVAAFVGPHRRGAALMAGFVVATAFVNYLVADKFGYWHVVEFYPFLAVAAALGLDGLAARRGVMRWIAPVALAAFMALGVADTGLAVARVGGYDYNQLIGEVRAKTPPGRTLAMDLYAPAFARGEFVAPWFGIDTPSRSCPPVEERVGALGVEYIVADELLMAFARMSCGEEYERELARFIFTACEPVGRVAASYPNYWVRGKLITEIYVFKVTAGSIK